MKIEYEGLGTVGISTSCPFCGVKNLVRVPQEQYDNWNSGMLIQNAMPNMSADDRELLMTGICNDCFPSEDY
jgi:hypothetical protein